MTNRSRDFFNGKFWECIHRKEKGFHTERSLWWSEARSAKLALFSLRCIESKQAHEDGKIMSLQNTKEMKIYGTWTPKVFFFCQRLPLYNPFRFKNHANLTVALITSLWLLILNNLWKGKFLKVNKASLQLLESKSTKLLLNFK